MKNNTYWNKLRMTIAYSAMQTTLKTLAWEVRESLKYNNIIKDIKLWTTNKNN